MTIQYDFDQVINRQESDCLKWHRFEAHVLPMWVADMDFRSPEPVIHALHERVEHGVFGYPDLGDCRTDLINDLCQSIVERMSTHFHWEIQPEDILFVPGVVTGFNLACHALAVPDGEILIQTPVYHPILDAARETGCQSRAMDLTHTLDGSYSVDFDLFKAQISPQSRLFILCNPHNPVGKVFQREELLRMAEVCLQHGVTICSDEIHCDLVFSGHHHIPVASLDPEIARNTITLMAPSKTYNLAGLQCSFAIVQNADLRKRLLSARKGLVPWVNLMGLQAALAAYQEGEEWLTQLMVYLEANRDFLVDTIHRQMPAIKIGVPEATYLAWLDCRELDLGESPHRFFLDKAGVGFNDGAAFGAAGEGFVRLNFGCPRALLSEGLERMQQALKKAASF